MVATAARPGSTFGPRVIARRAKRDLRDLYWLLRGDRGGLEPDYSSVRSLMFICKGNICRSPFAAAWARRIAPHLEIGSAGLRVPASIPSPETAVETAARLGIDLGGHRSMPLTEELIRRFDLTIVMEPWHAAAFEQMAAGTGGWALLSRFDPVETGWRSRAHARFHIEDPYGRDPQAFEQCFRRIQRCVAELVERCGAEHGPVSSASSKESTCPV
jgi:protein-tyrosine phosphatase